MGYRDAKNFFDRELSWLAFNRRVLEEALDPSNPLFERLKFLGIAVTNLDEFFMVRVSGVQEQIMSSVRVRNPAGYTPAMQFSLIHQEVRKQVERLYDCFREQILPTLSEEKIHLTHPSKLAPKLKKELREKFLDEIYPVLTPLAVDSGHPFPRLRNLSLNLILRLTGHKKKRSGEPLIAIVPVPSVLPRLIEVPAPRDGRRFVLLEHVINEHVQHLFPGLKVVESAPFRLTRDADIEYKEIESEDLLKYIETEIRERERGMAVRLQIDHKASGAMADFLAGMLGVGAQQIYRVNGPIAISELDALWKIEGHEHLKDAPFTPNIRRGFRQPGSIFSKIRRGDILVHHPYESFVSIVDFIGEAAKDPKVLAIKQTLYRTSGDSPIIRSLIEAAENGKQVAALVELKARFDEENNIVWARRLEEAGVHVVYGLVGLKTHCKAALVVRQEGNGLRRYVHLSTGNYNPTTARLYTDIGLFTCDPGFCDDASELLNLLTGYAHSPRWSRMIVAPEDLRDRTVALIAEQRERAESGKPSRIRAKMNSLVDTEIIIELYRASRAGVPIDLCVRGICCLRPGVKGLSETIRVWSIVDRFLEHSRVFIFGPDPNPKVYLSSADWMDRNMDRRIEVMFPVLDPALVSRCVDEVFAFSARDNVKARYLGADGKYRLSKPRSGEQAFRSQHEFLRLEQQFREEEQWIDEESAGTSEKPRAGKRKKAERKVAAAAEGLKLNAGAEAPEEFPGGPTVQAGPESQVPEAEGVLSDTA
ncbi:polyphosphate kinase 1 [Candidatus Poribacteria bacterium]|nr:polyphosphate kinase 1 [Candidatus Poribacteria bacterium]